MRASLLYRVAIRRKSLRQLKVASKAVRSAVKRGSPRPGLCSNRMSVTSVSVWMQDLLSAYDYLEGFWECIRVRRFGDGLGELRLCLQPLAQAHVR